MIYCSNNLVMQLLLILISKCAEVYKAFASPGKVSVFSMSEKYQTTGMKYRRYD